MPLAFRRRVDVGRARVHKGRRTIRGAPAGFDPKGVSLHGYVTEGSVVTASHHVEGAKPRRRKSSAAKARPRAASFIATRPRKLRMTLRGQAVEVEVVPAVGTTTHVNYKITIRRGGRILDWVPTRAEMERIGCAAGTQAKLETSH